jgi:hypothetical protein
MSRTQLLSGIKDRVDHLNVHTAGNGLLTQDLRARTVALCRCLQMRTVMI